MKRLLWLTPLLLGLSVTIIGYQNALDEERHFIQQSVQQRSMIASKLIENALRDHVDAAQEIAALMRMVPGPSLNGAKRASLIAQMKSIHAGELLQLDIVPASSLPSPNRFKPPLTAEELAQAQKGGRLVEILQRPDHTWIFRHIDWVPGAEPMLIVSDWNLQRLIYSVVAAIPDEGIDIEFAAIQQGKRLELYASRSGEALLRNAPWVKQSQFELAGVQFLLRFTPLKSWVEQTTSKQSRLVFLFGLLITLFFMLFLLNRNRNIDQLNQALRQQAEELELQRQELASVIDHAAEAILIADPEGRILRANPSASRLFGHEGDQWSQVHLQDLLPEETWKKVKSALHANDAGECSKKECQIRVRAKGGRLVPCEAHLERFLAGKEVRFSITLRDISLELIREWSDKTLLQLRRISQQRSDIRERLQEMLELLFTEPWGMLAGPAAIYLNEQGGLHLAASSAAWDEQYQRICPRLEGGACLHESGNCRVLHENSAPEAFLLQTDEAFEHNLFCLKVKHRGELLAILHLHLQADAPIPEQFQSFINHLEETLALMITSHQAEENLMQLSYYDPLTSLPNRRLFLDRLNHAIAMAKREKSKLAVLFMDLNRFKLINDTLGHDAGDEVLKQTAQRFRRFLRASDTAARLGGDEFAVLLPKTNAETALNVAKKILFSLQEPIHLPQQDVTIGTSIGIAGYPDDGTDADTLLKHADAAMYHAKKNHSHIHYFSREIEEDARRILALEQDLSQIVDKGELKLHYLAKAGALTDTDKANHAFPIHYQPKYRLRDQRIVGLECLVRWRHPILGIVPPNEFIHLAEETGYIHKISEWIIFQSCLQAAEWEREGIRPGRIAINISAVQLMHEGLAQDILRIIRRADADPHWVEIEITETAVMHDPNVATNIMQELVDAGISISIDDFGTGYSSLAYLKRFPVDTLKIDKAFIQDIPEGADDVAIVRSIIAMAHALGIKVLAEGVENESQLELLQRTGCDLAQGFWFSKPVAANEMTELIRRDLEK